MADSRRLRSWALWSVTNLAVVALLGVLLRYKIAWSMPGLNYKYLLNAHSHFAFVGWVTTALYTALLYIMVRAGRPLTGIYQILLWLNQAASYGMLVSFIWEGYDTVSIVFSALSVLVSFGFIFLYARDMRRVKLPRSVHLALVGALLFLLLSSNGPFLLAYSMSHGIGDRNFYFNAIYLYLHFQYNGWFTFAVLALFFYSLSSLGIPYCKRYSRWFLGLMLGACIPAYALSLLWTGPSIWVWIVAGISGLTQWLALPWLLLLIWRSRGELARLPSPVLILWTMSLVAFVLKIGLQGLSVIPALGRLAFGWRPVIIAYLHLVMLCFISFFLVGLMIREGWLVIDSTLARWGLGAWITGVLLNEGLLLGQSVGALSGVAWQQACYFLFAAAVLIFLGITALLSRQQRGQRSMIMNNRYAL